MSAVHRLFVHATIPRIRLTHVRSGGATMEEGAVQIGTRVCWAAGLAEFEHIRIDNLTRVRNFSGHVRFGPENEVAVFLSTAPFMQAGDALKISAMAWLADDAVENQQASIVQVDANNAVIEIRRVPARRIELDPASFPLPPAIEIVAIVP